MPSPPLRNFSRPKSPCSGICLGHQLLGLASGAKTVKMKFGHHGANHPVLGDRLRQGPDIVPKPWFRGGRVHACPPTCVPRNRSLFDGFAAGVARTDRPAFSFQGHPEASPGPHGLTVAVRAFHVLDGQAHPDELPPPQFSQTEIGWRVAPCQKKRPPKASSSSVPGPSSSARPCEFDYSGAQACKALKEEGFRVILVNSNPATIMTDPETADSIYIEPINWRTIERIIEKERPSALLPTMGGQTALNYGARPGARRRAREIQTSK